MNMNKKEIVWVGSSKKDLKQFSAEIQDDMGFGLYEAQLGRIPRDSKILKGFGGAGVIEIIALDNAGTYRTVYTVNMPEVVFVLHVFQKKSKEGIKTPKKEMDLVEARLKLAKELYKERIRK